MLFYEFEIWRKNFSVVESEYVKNYLTYTNGNVVNGMINLNYVSHVIVKECPYRETSMFLFYYNFSFKGSKLEKKKYF